MSMAGSAAIDIEQVRLRTANRDESYIRAVEAPIALALRQKQLCRDAADPSEAGYRILITCTGEAPFCLARDFASELLADRAQHDRVDVNIRRLLDREGDRARDRRCGDRLLVEVEHSVCGGAGRAVLEVAIDRSGLDRGHAQFVANLLAQPLRYRTDREFLKFNSIGISCCH